MNQRFLYLGATALLLACAAVRAIVAFAPPDTPRLDEISLDWRVLMFTLVVTMAAGLLFGIFPAWQAAKLPVVQALRRVE